MRAALAFATALVAGVASANPIVERQEALRFGVLDVSPSQVAIGDEIQINYNSTKAYYQPEYVDVYLQGTRSNGYNTPQVLIARHDYQPTQKSLIFNATIPDVSAFGDDISSWLLWSFITYNYDNITGLDLYGGTSAPLSITF